MRLPTSYEFDCRCVEKSKMYFLRGKDCGRKEFTKRLHYKCDICKKGEANTAAE
jgi:hypothetical protein